MKTRLSLLVIYLLIVACGENPSSPSSPNQPAPEQIEARVDVDVLAQDLEQAYQVWLSECARFGVQAAKSDQLQVQAFVLGMISPSVLWRVKEHDLFTVLEVFRTNVESSLRGEQFKTLATKLVKGN